jgi:hypothetical protein
MKNQEWEIEILNRQFFEKEQAKIKGLAIDFKLQLIG